MKLCKNGMNNLEKSDTIVDELSSILWQRILF